MIDIITFLDNNGKYCFSTGGYIHGIYRYLDIIGAPVALNTSVQNSYHLSDSYSINNDT